MVSTQRELAVSTDRTSSAGLMHKIAAAAVVCLCAGLLWAQAPAGPSAAVKEDAQGYKYQEPMEAFTNPKNKGKLNEHKLKIRNIVTSTPSPISDAASRGMVEQYYTQYFFPMMTTEEGLKTIAAERGNFTRDLAGAKDPAAHSYLAGLALSSLSKIVPDNYRVASRYNAMLMISNLNDVEPSMPQTLPEPMRAALPFILQQFQKADNPDAIKLAALLGLSRHLEFDGYRQPAAAMPAATKAEVIKELTAVAQLNEPPVGRDLEAHLWFRRRAIEALALACVAKPDADVATNLQALLADDATPLAVRCAAVAAMGKMSLQPPVKVDVVPLAKEMGYVALLVCDTELTSAENFHKSDYEHQARLAGTYAGELEGGLGGPGMSAMPGMSRMGPGGGMPGSPDGGVRGPLRATPQSMLPGGGGEYGGEYAMPFDPSLLDPKHYRMEYIRRRIRQQLYAVQLGLTGGEDFVKPKPGSSLPPNTEKAGGPANPQAEKKGVLALAKPTEKAAVLDIYYEVRTLVELVESTAREVELAALLKTMRGAMKPLEGLTRRLPPPGEVAAGPGAVAKDDPSKAAAKAKKKSAGPAKGATKVPTKGVAAPGGKAPPGVAPPPGKRPPVPGKAAIRPQATPVFGRPGR